MIRKGLEVDFAGKPRKVLIGCQPALASEVESSIPSYYSTCLVSSANELKEVLVDERFDLLILSERLPGFDFREFLAEFRKVEEQSSVVILLAKLEDKRVFDVYHWGGDLCLSEDEAPASIGEFLDDLLLRPD